MSRPDFEADLIAMLPHLHRYGLRLSRRKDMADDLVQATAERALMARDRLDPDRPMKPWLLRILHNAFIDMTRRTRTRGQEVDVFDMPEAATVDGARVTETALMLSATERALAALPQDQRAVLLLVCYQEMSYAETAEILDVPIGTVMSRLGRARSALAQHLGIK